jgi:hypothetical protein
MLFDVTEGKSNGGGYWRCDYTIKMIWTGTVPLSTLALLVNGAINNDSTNIKGKPLRLSHLVILWQFQNGEVY